MIQLPVWATLAGTYSATLVTASVMVAVLASYVALQLASRVIATTGRVRLAWLLGGAVAMGAGIWAMHFVGMLAFRLEDRPITYDPLHLTLSVLVAVAASGFALWVVSLGAGSWRPLMLGAVAMGGAIAGMHYLGMAGLHTAAILTWRPELVAASVGIAILASGTGLGLAAWFQSDESWTTRKRPPRLGSRLPGWSRRRDSLSSLSPQPSLSSASPWREASPIAISAGLLPSIAASAPARRHWQRRRG